MLLTVRLPTLIVPTPIVYAAIHYSALALAIVEGKLVLPR